MKTKVKNNRPLTRKQQAFVNHLIENPKSSATEAAHQSYNFKDRNTSRAVAAQNLSKPSIISALAAHNQLIENTLINTVNDYSNSDKLGQRSLAVDTAKYIHDKIHGKAVQQIQSTSTAVTISIDLAGTLDQE